MAEVTSGNIDTVLILTRTEADALGRLVARRAVNYQWFTDVLEKHEQYALDCVAEALCTSDEYYDHQGDTCPVHECGDDARPLIRMGSK